MPLTRSHCCGAPHTYRIWVRTALDLPRLANPLACSTLSHHLEKVRHVFDVSLYAWSIRPSGLDLILRHRSASSESSAALAHRWAVLGGRSTPDAQRLRQRMTSLEGLMQTLLQTASRSLSRACGGSGTWWAPRYRSCLLADDSALVVAVGRLEAQPQQMAGSGHADEQSPRLAALPLTVMPDGAVVPRDVAPFGVMPPQPGRDRLLLARFLSVLAAGERQAYDDALAKAWALGHPESLTETLDRLGRGPGRGRTRRLRELDDELGLCGVWG